MVLGAPITRVGQLCLAKYSAGEEEEEEEEEK